MRVGEEQGRNTEESGGFCGKGKEREREIKRWTYRFGRGH